MIVLRVPRSILAAYCRVTCTFHNPKHIMPPIIPDQWFFVRRGKRCKYTGRRPFDVIYLDHKPDHKGRLKWMDMRGGWLTLDGAREAARLYDEEQAACAAWTGDPRAVGMEVEVPFIKHLEAFDQAAFERERADA